MIGTVSALISAVVFLIIGLPTLLVGCNSTFCPLQAATTGTVQSNSITKDSCSYCAGYANGACTVLIFYDCWDLEVIYEYSHPSMGRCSVGYSYDNEGNVRSDSSGLFATSTEHALYVRRTDGVCSTDIAEKSGVENTGIAFMSMTGMALIVAGVLAYFRI